MSSKVCQLIGDLTYAVRSGREESKSQLSRTSPPLTWRAKLSWRNIPLPDLSIIALYDSGAIEPGMDWQAALLESISSTVCLAEL